MITQIPNVLLDKFVLRIRMVESLVLRLKFDAGLLMDSLSREHVQLEWVAFLLLVIQPLKTVHIAHQFVLLQIQPARVSIVALIILLLKEFVHCLLTQLL